MNNSRKYTSTTLSKAQFFQSTFPINYVHFVRVRNVESTWKKVDTCVDVSMFTFTFVIVLFLKHTRVMQNNVGNVSVHWWLRIDIFFFWQYDSLLFHL